MPNFEVNFEGNRPLPSLRDMQQHTYLDIDDVDSDLLEPEVTAFMAIEPEQAWLDELVDMTELHSPVIQQEEEDEVIIDLTDAAMAAQAEEAYAPMKVFASVASGGQNGQNEIPNIFKKPDPSKGQVSPSVLEHMLPPAKPAKPQPPRPRSMFDRTEWVHDEPDIELDSTPEVVATIEVEEADVAVDGLTSTVHHTHHRSRRHRTSTEHTTEPVKAPKPKLFQKILNRIKPSREESRFNSRRKVGMVAAGIAVSALAVLGTVHFSQGDQAESTTSSVPKTEQATRPSYIKPVTTVQNRVERPSLATVDKYVSFYGAKFSLTNEDIKAYDKAFADMIAWYEANPGGDLAQALQNFQAS